MLTRRLYCASILVLLLNTCGSPLLAGEQLRTWTSRDGQYAVKAELQGHRGGSLLLRREDGTMIEVPLDKLTEADARHARETLKIAPAVDDGGEAANTSAAPELVASLQVAPAIVESAANSYRTSREALTLYRAYYAAVPATETTKFSVDSSLAKWQQLAAENQLRLGRTWVTREKYDDARRAARELIVLSLQQLQENVGDKARDSLAEAARLDPESATAPSVMGLTYAISLRNYEQAKSQFTEAIRRDPFDAAAINNLGLVEFRTGNSTAAVSRWMQAIDLAPNSPEISHNIFHLLSEIEKKSIPEPSFGMNPVRVLQKRLSEASVTDPRPDTGWLYLPPTSNSGMSQAETTDRLGRRQSSTIVVGKQTGIAVSPNHVLTYVDLLDSPNEIFVSQPKSDAMPLSQPAEIVAHDPSSGLLLLKVDRLEGAPIQFTDQFPRVGTNVGLVGFSKPTHFTDSRSAVRGTLVSTPSAESGEYFLCATKVGLGAGACPVADSAGHAIGVAVLNQKFGQQTAFALSNRAVLKFLTQHLPNYQPATGNRPQQSWEKVDAALLDGLVLIETRKHLRADLCRTLQKPGVTNSFRADDSSIYEDVYCNRCRGLGAVNCPVTGCANGGVLVQVRTVIGRGSGGEEIYKLDKVRTRCEYCEGQGKVRCPACSDGRAAGL